MEQQSVLVTGGTGFIGRRVIERFMREGWTVSSLALPGEASPDAWAGRVKQQFGDIMALGSIRAAATNCDLIVHLAGLVGHGGDYDRQWAIFVDGTRNICEAASAVRARLVVSSSIAVYGTFIQARTCHEDIGHGPWAGAYGRAKQGQENVSRDIAAREGLDLTLIRPANVYGLGGGGAWGDRLLDAISAGGGALIGDADANNAGLVHVDNLAEAIYLAGTHANAVGRTYNVCDNEDVSWARFMTDMAGLVGRPRPVAFALDDVLQLVRANEDPAALIAPKDPDLPFMEGLNLVGFDNKIPSDRIRTELGWAPATTYAQAMASWRGARNQPAAHRDTQDPRNLH